MIKNKYLKGKTELNKYKFKNDVQKIYYIYLINKVFIEKMCPQEKNNMLFSVGFKEWFNMHIWNITRAGLGKHAIINNNNTFQVVEKVNLLNTD